MFTRVVGEAKTLLVLLAAVYWTGDGVKVVQVPAVQTTDGDGAIPSSMEVLAVAVADRAH